MNINQIKIGMQFYYVDDLEKGLGKVVGRKIFNYSKTKFVVQWPDGTTKELFARELKRTKDTEKKDLPKIYWSF